MLRDLRLTICGIKLIYIAKLCLKKLSLLCLVNRLLNYRQENIMQKDLVIIRTDGGFCSQIAFCALGKYFEDKGFCVKYDMEFFKKYGVDAATYLIDKAFPNLKIEFATDDEVECYRHKYRRKNQPLDKCKPPIYIDGYPEERPFLVVRYKTFFSKEFIFDSNDLEQENLLKEIQTSNSCCVHIRRGDLVKNGCYGKVADREYFLKAIHIINKTNDNVCFYFFSDEMDWVKENIIPYITHLNYKICDKNGLDRSNLDLYLATWCKYIISSNGSLGLFAKILSHHQNTQLYMPKYWDFICESAELDSVYIINDPEIKMFKSNNVWKPLNSSLIDKRKIQKYKKLFNVFLVISILYTIIFIILLVKKAFCND